jgi:hypothetical protein
MAVAAFLEIVETEDGDVLLRRSDSSPGNAEPLVTLHFSPEARAMLGDHLGEIARSMIGAGVQTAGQVFAGNGMMSAEDEPRLLH